MKMRTKFGLLSFLVRGRLFPAQLGAASNAAPIPIAFKKSRRLCFAVFIFNARIRSSCSLGIAHEFYVKAAAIPKPPPRRVCDFGLEAATRKW
jgi:hypothetical protein